MDSLLFNEEAFEIRTETVNGETIKFRAFEGISYCCSPKDDIQKLNIYAPEVYYHGGSINGYTLKSAPIFMPNSVGGYMAGPAECPGERHFADHYLGEPNSLFLALQHGYVVASAGIRGRNSGQRSNEMFVGGQGDNGGAKTGIPCGKAPALIVDMKAAIRYLRHNKDIIPGDTEKIITNGTSAGGALSSLAGATGNAADYEPYLKEIGAADERDDIFAANCYCPIHNLENADSAYEWRFNGENIYHMTKFVRENGAGRRVAIDEPLSEKQIQVSAELKALFPEYVNGLGLKAADGSILTLDPDGNGSFRDYVAGLVIASAQAELDNHYTAKNIKDRMVAGSEVEKQGYLTIEDGKVTGLDWKSYVAAITRMKPAPSFDALDLNSPECEEFGTETIGKQHFTQYSFEHSEASAGLADPALIKMLNPVKYIGEADTAPNWRIRHGAYDRDTSIAIPTILATLLKNKGFNVDFALPWGLPHSGDYDIPLMFEWIDGLCR